MTTPAPSGGSPSLAGPATGPSAGDSRSGRTVRIGITGPIGCGKSTVAGSLGELGAVVVDADDVAREVTSPGSPALVEIAATFGSNLVREDGSLDRAALGRIVFGNPAALATLEAIVHPAVRPVILESMARAERAGAPALAVEAIKLIEGGLGDLCDEIWLVACSADVQLARLRARLVADGTDPADAEARIAAQSDLVTRLTPSATRILDTSGSIEESRRLVASAYADALARHGSATPT